MALTRGDVVIIADGKPRPAVIVQSDIFPTPTNVLICPLTSDLADVRLYRAQVEPSASNGLKTVSHLMTDRLTPVRRDRIGAVIGRLSDPEMQLLADAIMLILDLGD